MQFEAAAILLLFQAFPVAEEAKAYENAEEVVREYALSPSGKLEALLQLELKIYQKLKQLLPAKNALVSITPGPTDLLVQSYLEDFDQATRNTSFVLQNHEIVGKILENPLAIYRMLWRFENYIKKILRLPAEDKKARRGESS